ELKLGQISAREPKVVGLPPHLVEVGDGVLKAFNDVANVNVVAFEIALENHNGAVRDSPPGKVVDKEVDAHSWRHAENRRQTQRHTVTLLKNRLLGFDLGYAIKRDGPERCLFGAELSGFSNAIARVGRWIDDNLRLGDTLCQRNDGIPVHSPGGDRIFIAQGS